MVRSFLILLLIFCPTLVFAQSFECAIRDGGVDLYGTNNIDRVLRCSVKCTYWHPDGTEGYQSCSVQMQPSSQRQIYCSWNLNDAKTIIGVSHSCQ
jgi:hypothetical protein